MKNNIFIFICIFCCFHTNKCLCQNEIVDAYFSTNLMELRNLVNNSSSNVKILNRKYLEFLATLNLLSDGEICNYNPHIPPIVNIYELNIIEKWYLKNRKVITYEIVDKIKNIFLSLIHLMIYHLFLIYILAILIQFSCLNTKRTCIFLHINIC